MDSKEKAYIFLKYTNIVKTAKPKICWSCDMLVTCEWIFLLCISELFLRKLFCPLKFVRTQQSIISNTADNQRSLLCIMLPWKPHAITVCSCLLHITCTHRSFTLYSVKFLNHYLVTHEGHWSCFYCSLDNQAKKITTEKLTSLKAAA